MVRNNNPINIFMDGTINDFRTHKSKQQNFSDGYQPIPL